MPGFKTLVREQVQVATGFTAQIQRAARDLGDLQETVTVTSESPLINTRQRGTESTFTQDMLQNIPSARDPWVILERAPGITMDRSNVGGTASGQQSGFISRGSNTTNNMWSIDGVVVTDLVATGASAIYYDFDSFEEIQISTGGNDASLQTGGVGINLVTKSGTDRFKGTGRYYLTDEKFQADNVDDALRAQNATSGNPIQRDRGLRARGRRPDLPRPRVGLGQLRQAGHQRRHPRLLQVAGGLSAGHGRVDEGHSRLPAAGHDPARQLQHQGQRRAVQATTRRRG